MHRTIFLLIPIVAGFCGFPAILREPDSADVRLIETSTIPPNGPRYRSGSSNDAVSGSDIAVTRNRRKKSSQAPEPKETVDQSIQQTCEQPGEVPRSDATALATVYRKLLELRRQHECLMQQDDHRGAKKLAGRIEDLERRFRYPVPAPNHQEPIVHAVGTYSQRNVKQPVNVTVTDTSGPIVLVLTAYNAVTWNVEAAKDAQIDFIICTGYYDQKIGCIPNGTPVFQYSYYQNAGEYAYAYGSDRSEWGSLEKFVARHTGGLSIQTALGSYYSHDEYLIGPENVHWRVQMLNQQQ